MMRVSEKGLELFRSFEGCRLTAYQCSAGRWTIGYGHTGKDVVVGLQITQALPVCFMGCRSMKQTETSEQRIETERIGQEVILLPESERLIVDLSTLDRLTPATEFVAPKDKSGGLTVKKRADGLIEIESRRDMVRIRGDTVCSHEYLNLDSVVHRETGRPWVIVLAVFLLLLMMVMVYARR